MYQNTSSEVLRRAFRDAGFLVSRVRGMIGYPDCAASRYRIEITIDPSTEIISMLDNSLKNLMERKKVKISDVGLHFTKSSKKTFYVEFVVFLGSVRSLK